MYVLVGCAVRSRASVVPPCAHLAFLVHALAMVPARCLPVATLASLPALIVAPLPATEDPRSRSICPPVRQFLPSPPRSRSIAHRPSHQFRHGVHVRLPISCLEPVPRFRLSSLPAHPGDQNSPALPLASPRPDVLSGPCWQAPGRHKSTLSPPFRERHMMNRKLSMDWEQQV